MFKRLIRWLRDKFMMIPVKIQIVFAVIVIRK